MSRLYQGTYITGFSVPETWLADGMAPEGYFEVWFK